MDSGSRRKPQFTLLGLVKAVFVVGGLQAVFFSNKAQFEKNAFDAASGDLQAYKAISALGPLYYNKAIHLERGEKIINDSNPNVAKLFLHNCTPQALKEAFESGYLDPLSDIGNGDTVLSFLCSRVHAGGSRVGAERREKYMYDYEAKVELTLKFLERNGDYDKEILSGALKATISETNAYIRNSGFTESTNGSDTVVWKKVIKPLVNAGADCSMLSSDNVYKIIGSEIAGEFLKSYDFNQISVETWVDQLGIIKGRLNNAPNALDINSANIIKKGLVKISENVNELNAKDVKDLARLYICIRNERSFGRNTQGVLDSFPNCIKKSVQLIEDTKKRQEAELQNTTSAQSPGISAKVHNVDCVQDHVTWIEQSAARDKVNHANAQSGSWARG